MTVTLKYGNGRNVPTRNFRCYADTIELWLQPDTENSFMHAIDSGLTIIVDNGVVEQKIKVDRDEYNVIPVRDSNFYLRFTGKLREKIALIIDGNFYYPSSDQARDLGRELGETLLRQIMTAADKRKAVRVLLRSPVEHVVLSVLSAIGYNRVSRGMTHRDFIRSYTPDMAVNAMKAVLCNADLNVTFEQMPDDGRRRELFSSVIGENRLEFAEQAGAK